MRRLLIICTILGLYCGLAMTARAFSVQDIKIESHLNMPFVATVPLLMKPYQRDKGFVAVIGDTADYEAEHLTRAPVVDYLAATVLMGPPDAIRIVSKKPINVGEFALVLLVRTGQVTIVRNYSIKLSAPPSSANVISRIGSDSLANFTTHAKIKTTLAPGQRVQARQSTVSTELQWVAQLPKRYGPVLPGESLYRIMKRLEIPKGYIWSVAVLTWKYNPKHFARENIHGLRAGVYLDLPINLGTELTQVDEVSARQIIVHQRALWRKLMSAVAVRPAASPVATPNNAVDTALEGDFAGDTKTEAHEIVMSNDAPGHELSVAKLESVVQGLEDRLIQRLFLPEISTEASVDNTLTFVSVTDLQSAIQNLEGRLTQRLEEVKQQRAQIDPSRSLMSQPHLLTPALPTGATIGRSMGSILSSNTMTIVLLAQNLILVGLTVGFAWHWYRKRA